MVIFDRAMKLPLRLEERKDTDDLETYGSIDMIDQNNDYVALVMAEDYENRDEENILNTRKDAIFILNAVNGFDEMNDLIMNYQKLLLMTDSKNKDLIRINNLIKSFKTIDYENGIPYHWDDYDI